MGDRRYDASYDAVVTAPDKAAQLRSMSDDEVVYALAAASRKMDAYLANVLAVETLRRQHRHRAAFWGSVVGLGSAVVSRTSVLLAWPEHVLEGSILAALASAIVGYVVYRVVLMRVGHE